MELKGESNIHVIRFETFIDFSTSVEWILIVSS